MFLFPRCAAVRLLRPPWGTSGPARAMPRDGREATACLAVNGRQAVGEPLLVSAALCGCTAVAALQVSRSTRARRSVCSFRTAAASLWARAAELGQGREKARESVEQQMVVL